MVGLLVKPSAPGLFLLHRFSASFNIGLAQMEDVFYLNNLPTFSFLKLLINGSYLLVLTSSTQNVGPTVPNLYVVLKQINQSTKETQNMSRARVFRLYKL